jgi:GNAT superfamily N-acetyltransferase
VPDDNPPSPYTIENAAPWLPEGLAGLRREAGDEGIRIVGVIVDRWLDGSQRYDGPGEALLVARRASDGRIVAVGGLAWCPDVDGALRVRRFYVSPAARRQGIARALARRLIDDAATHTSTITCNAKASAAAPPFWESLGFRPVDTDGITHRLDVMTSDGAPTKMDR